MRGMLLKYRLCDSVKMGRSGEQWVGEVLSEEDTQREIRQVWSFHTIITVAMDS